MALWKANECFNGNRKLRGTDTPYPYTQWEINELAKCKADPLYFIETYMMIVHPDKGVIHFHLWDFQKALIRALHANRYVIGKVGRQSGKSTTIIGYLLWYILFHKEKSCAVAALKEVTARKTLRRLKDAFLHLPNFLQQPVTVWNVLSVEFANGSGIEVGSTSESSIRGGTHSILFLDEFAHVPTNIAMEFYESVLPTISQGKETKCFIISTPKGLNFFHTLWKMAEDKENEFVTFEAHWTEVPGRDEAWKKQQIGILGSEEAFRQEFDTDFIGSSHTLIDHNTLRRLKAQKAVYSKDGLYIYSEPEKGHKYIMVVDPAEGVGIDYSAIQVVDITEYPYQQVATFRDQNITALMLPNVIDTLGRQYNEADCLVETNNNGGQVRDILAMDLEYPNMIQIEFGKNKGPGVKTLKNVKAQGCSNLKSLVENDKLIINDVHTIAELNRFVRTGTTYKADKDDKESHDDTVMALVLFGWLTQQEYFKGLTDDDLRRRLAEEKANEVEAGTFFGFHSSDPTASDEGLDWGNFNLTPAERAKKKKDEDDWSWNF